MPGVRSLQREVARKKRMFMQRLNKPSETINNSYALGNDVAISTENNVEDINVPHKVELTEKLKQLFLKHHVGRRLGDDLLNVLYEEGLNVPNSTKKLLNRGKKCIVTRTVNPGKYFHFGLKNQVLKLSEFLKDIDVIQLDIGIDGLPLFKSSSVGLWPILGKLINCKFDCVFPIGIYCGNKKPVCINSFLHDLIIELKELFASGISYENKNIAVVVRAFICDAPARAFVTGCVGHNAFHGCSRCLQVGRKVEHVTVYSDIPGERRTDDMFKSRMCPDHHSVMFRINATDLEEANINMVTQFPIDPMHLFDLGVTRKMLNALVKKMNSNDKTSMTNGLLSTVGYIPKEFGRTPRPIDELKRWKATEYRQFLLYTGIVVLKDIVDDDTFYHFLLIHCAYRLLCCPYSFQNNLEASENLLQDFVKFFPNIYGEKNLTYNVHNLLHVCECVREMGLLTNFSAYDFENFMQSLKKCVRKPHQILQQIRNNYEDKTIIIDKKEISCDKRKGKLLKVNGTNCYLSYCFPNNLCLLKDEPNGDMGTIVKITRIEDSVFYGVALSNLENVYTLPVPSKQLGIAEIENLEGGNEFLLDIDIIKCKMMCLPYKQKFVIIPILHNCV